jgi:hypothetical protein
MKWTPLDQPLTEKRCGCKVIPLTKEQENKPADRAKRAQALNRAVDEIKRDTGIDFRKLILGDPKEKARYELRLLQDRMKETNEED